MDREKDFNQIWQNNSHTAYKKTKTNKPKKQRTTLPTTTTSKTGFSSQRRNTENVNPQRRKCAQVHSMDHWESWGVQRISSDWRSPCQRAPGRAFHQRKGATLQDLCTSLHLPIYLLIPCWFLFPDRNFLTVRATVCIFTSSESRVEPLLVTKQVSGTASIMEGDWSKMKKVEFNILPNPPTGE